jgi:hypothetical protein
VGTSSTGRRRAKLVWMPHYTGKSQFVHWWPWFMVVFAVVQYATDQRYLGYAILFASGGLLFAWVLPWRFVVVEDGIGLWFTFGKRRFLPKSEVVVRAGLGSPVAYRGENRRFGYPLTDGLVEQRRRALTEVLTFLGFRLV